MLPKSGTVRAFSCLVFLLCSQLAVSSALGSGIIYEGTGPASVGTVARLVKKEERTPIVSTEFGSISAVDIDDGTGWHNHHLQFITLEPNALFLPVLLHADMVFYVHTGSGSLSWTDGDDVNKVSLKRGDVYRLQSGTFFYLYSSLEPERPRFRFIAIFTNPDEKTLQEPSVGPYSSITDLIRGFDKRVLQASFQVPEEVIEEITSVTDTPAIVHAETERKKKFWEEEILLLNSFFGMNRFSKQTIENKKKKHTKTFNIFKDDPDFENCYGWSKVVTGHDLHALRGTQIGIHMVNLTKGSMMGPHWNPTATEVSIVLDGEGMVRVVCPSSLTNKECKNARMRVEEGDVFAVPRFHPMAHTSFNNGSLVFMGFSTTSKRNHPQFLAGKASVLQMLDKPILSASFNVSNTTVDQMLSGQQESIILECISCAEEQEMLMEEEITRERQEEEERKQREEEAKRREEEERRREEEERRRQEEEEERRREEQQRKRAEEQRRQQEEEERRRKEEEEQKKRQEEEEQRKQQEEEERRRQEEEKKRSEEEQRQQQEEEQRRQQEEERRRQQEEEEQRRQEEEEEQRRQEEEERQRREEEQRRQEEEMQRQAEEERRMEQEEEQRRREEERQAEQEEEEEEQRQQAEMQRQAEKRRRMEREQEQRRQEEEWEEERERQEEQKREKEQQEGEGEEEWEWEQPERQEEEEQERGRGEETEGEIARREEEERVKREREAGRGWRGTQPKTYRQNQGKKATTAKKEVNHLKEPNSGANKGEGRRHRRVVSKVSDAPW